jgi:glycosyltransferase involved in cell wall biosynthesis
MIILNPKYAHLQESIEDVLQTFDSQGKVIYHDRNTIRTIELSPTLSICVKKFHCPSLLKRLIYTFLRTPKAVRAYENAFEILKRGIDTPEPLACVVETKGGLIADSYLITKKSDLDHTFYDFRDGNISNKEELIADFAAWTASMHDAGVLHLDYSPGNILYDKINDQWRFEVVDINRVKFIKVSHRKGCAGFCRLWGKLDFFECVARTYAECRNIPIRDCWRWMLKARKRFWRHRSTEHFVNENTFSIGVIISTYNNPQWLEKVLWGLKYQTHQADEIIIADDGSGEQTKELILKYSEILPIKHVWHPDMGFRKTKILNEAVRISESDYIIFMDQDLIPRSDFVSMHYRNARKNHFISGGAIVIPESFSHAITEEDIKSGRAFSIKWIKSQGVRVTWKYSKLWTNSVICALLNRLTPTNASWNGGNASTWREYIIQANGFDTRMRYGAEDREFGQRLENKGYKGIQLRYGIPLLHLYHQRPYKNQQDWEYNVRIWNDTKKYRYTKTIYGIEEL